MSRGSPAPLLLCCATAWLFNAEPAAAFPPYRSTDAGTADPYDLELRLGLGKVERKAGETEVLSPLLRANVGLPHGIEVVTELEYSPHADRLADGALGGKWVPLSGTISAGIEALALIPVNRSHSGTGVEAQLLATVSKQGYRIHVNAGGFHDPRGGIVEAGWRASALGEIVSRNYRVGIELFAKDTNIRRADVRAGVGVIYSLAGFDLRPGVHIGLTEEAPDIGVSLWIATKFSLGGGSR